MEWTDIETTNPKTGSSMQMIIINRGHKTEAIECFQNRKDLCRVVSIEEALKVKEKAKNSGMEWVEFDKKNLEKSTRNDPRTVNNFRF